MRGGVSGRLIAGHREKQHEGVNLELVERGRVAVVAYYLRIDKSGDDVVAGVFPSLSGQGVGVGVQLSGRSPVVVTGVLGVVDADHLVRPVEELLSVLLRDAHNLGDGLEGEFRGYVDHEVTFAVLDHLVDDEGGPVAEVLLEESDHPRGEPSVHQLAVPGVLGRVGGQHKHPAQVKAPGPFFDGGGLGDGDAPHFGGEKFGLPVHLDQVVVADHVPEARPVRLLVPVERVLPAEQGEHVVVLLGYEPVEVEEVHVIKSHRDPRGLQR